MDAGGRLLAHASDGVADLAIPAGKGREPPLDRGEKNFLFLIAGLVEKGSVASLGANAEMNEQRGVAAIVQNEVWRAAVAPLENLMGIFPVVVEAFPLRAKTGMPAAAIAAAA